MAIYPEARGCLYSYPGECVIEPMIGLLRDVVREESEELPDDVTIRKEMDKHPENFSSQTIHLRNAIKSSACGNCDWR